MSGEDRLKQLGEFIRARRRVANLSLRQLSSLAKVSNPYLSQIERGIYKPSAEVLKGIADALEISAEALFARAGLLGKDAAPHAVSVEEAICADPLLTEDQKQTLVGVYRNFVGVREKSARGT